MLPFVLLLASVGQTGGPQEAQTAYRELWGRVAKIRTLQMTETATRPGGEVVDTVRYKFARPNFSRSVEFFPRERATLTQVGDGTTEWFLGPEGYIKHPALPDAMREGPTGFEQFSNPKDFVFEFLDVAQSNFFGEPVTQIDMKYKGDSPMRIALYLDRKTKFPVGYRLTSTKNSRILFGRYSEVLVDQVIDRSEFVMRLPNRAKPYSPGRSSS